MSLADLRHEFGRGELHEADAGSDPVILLQRWLAEALRSSEREPTAMTLATVTPEGWPAARVVLLKGVDERGLTFFTNYDSDKGVELTRHPVAALVLFWPSLERQVRVTGKVSRTNAEESEAYFRSRPRGSQLGAWASQQSKVIGGLDELEAKLAEMERLFEGREVAMPGNWGGFRVSLQVVEFWQGRENRLHDRLRYRRGGDGGWVRERLGP
ncbi:MAG: pyridoxamine 5'-phosphate oxidase [Phycisphaeraceae bacterium]|nr:pyridoxamine 5'-phosphate oxidase [Phycisphaeraceae bacterium]